MHVPGNDAAACPGNEKREVRPPKRWGKTKDIPSEGINREMGAAIIPVEYKGKEKSRARVKDARRHGRQWDLLLRQKSSRRRRILFLFKTKQNLPRSQGPSAGSSRGRRGGEQIKTRHVCVLLNMG